MKLLLDTHVAIWSLAASDRLDERERRMISNPSNQVLVSSVTILEIAIKKSLGRASAPPFTSKEAIAGFALVGYGMLNVTAVHAAAVETLQNHHGDPFDRLLVAQALTEPLRLLTHDKTLTRYSDTVICFG